MSLSDWVPWILILIALVGIATSSCSEQKQEEPKGTHLELRCRVNDAKDCLKNLEAICPNPILQLTTFDGQVVIRQYLCGTSK